MIWTWGQKNKKSTIAQTVDQMCTYGRIDALAHPMSLVKSKKEMKLLYQVIRSPESA